MKKHILENLIRRINISRRLSHDKRPTTQKPKLGNIVPLFLATHDQTPLWT